jgi:cytochrome b subunit of formate dehydrogenase
MKIKMWILSLFWSQQKEKILPTERTKIHCTLVRLYNYYRPIHKYDYCLCMCLFIFVIVHYIQHKRITKTKIQRLYYTRRFNLRTGFLVPKCTTPKTLAVDIVQHMFFLLVNKSKIVKFLYTKIYIYFYIHNLPARNIEIHRSTSLRSSTFEFLFRCTVTPTN